jgi:hypothetical protein
MMMGTHDHRPQGETAAATLRRRLDRGVAVAWIVRLLGWLGRVAIVAALALLAVHAAELLGMPAGVSLGRWPVIIAVLLGAVAAWWRWAGRAPFRLDVARAIEATHADVGERISRAVAFLEPATDAPREAPLTRGLRTLAIDDAAQAIAAIRRLPVPGLRRHVPWVVVGTVAVIAAFMVPRSERGRLDERRADPSAQQSPPSIPAVEHTEIAARLAAAAATEAHLAEVLARSFAAAPGRMVDTLPQDEQQNLVILGAIHEESLQTVRLIRAELAIHDSPAAQAAARQLGLLDDKAIGSIGVAISGNRLASAATGAARYADELMAAAQSLGGGATGDAMPIQPLPPRDGVRMRRAEVALADVERQLEVGRQETAGREAAVATAGEPSDQERRQSGPNRAGPTGAEPGGPVTSAAPSDPRFAAGDAAIARPPAAAERSQARVWSLLPEAVQPFASSGGDADVPTDYRAAVDRYYQLVLEQLVPEQVESP